MARSAKEIIQNAIDKKGAKNVDNTADRDTLLNNIDRITHLQEIYKKIDNLETLTDEERKDWQSLSKEDKMQVIDAYNGVNMNMRQGSTFADLDVHTKDYSDLAPETSPKDLESEKVFNPSEADDSGVSMYDKLVTAVANLKSRGKSPAFIKAMLKAVPEYKTDGKVDVPVWGENEIVDSRPVDIDKVIDDLVGKELTQEEIERSKALTEASKRKEDELHQQRMAAIPENQERSAAEQARITEGYKDEVNPDISEGGKDALYADLDKAKDAGFIKQVDNNINRLAGKNNDTEFANKVIDELLRSKNAGKSFTSSLSTKTLQELAKRFPNTKTKEGKTINNIKPVLDGLKDTYDHKSFGRLKSSLNMINSKGNTAKSRLARENERVNETTGTEKGAQEATARSVRPGSLAKREGVTAFDKAFAGGTEADAAKKALAQDVNAYDEAFSKDPELAKQVRQSVSDAQKAKYTVEDWIEYFENHPGVRFHNQANVRTVNNGVLLLTAINPEMDVNGNVAMTDITRDKKGNINSSGKTKETLLDGVVMDKFPLIREADVTNFLQALQQVDPVVRPEIKTEFTNLGTKATDATEDSSRNKKWAERFDRMFNTGDKFYVYADPRLSKKTVRDENGIVTEYDRDPKKASGPSLRSADYFNQLSGILRGKDNLDDINVSELYDLIRALHDDTAAKKAKDLYYDVSELNNTFGPVLSKDTIDPSTLRSFAGKFNRLRKLNPNMSLTDIFNKGDVSDVFGVKIHPKFVGNDKFGRTDLLKAALKLAKYKKQVAKEGIDFDALRSDLDDNIRAYKNSVDSNDFSNLPEGVNAGLAKEALDTLNTIRSYVDTPAEREAKLRGQLVGTPDASGLKSLADEAPEEFERAEAEYKNAMNEYALAKQNKDTDFDVLNMLRKDVEETRSKMKYLKDTKVDILKRAEELGKPYHEVLDDYLHPDWDEDDMELNIQKMLNEYDLMDELKASAGGNIHNSNVKANAIAEALDKLSGVDPRFEKWRDTLNNWSRPVAASQIMSSPDTAKQYLDMTPAEWSAYNTNKGFFDSDIEQKRRNTTLTGQRKSAKGIAGADTIALNKLAQDLQRMDYTDDTAGKKALYDKLQAENARTADPYTRDKDIDERLANAIKGVLANRPGED